MSKRIDGHVHMEATVKGRDRLVESLDANGFDQAVVVAGGLVPRKVLGALFSRSHASPAEIVADNYSVLDLCRSTKGRLLPFYFANPWLPVDDYARIGASFVGLKLAPVLHGARFDSDETTAYVEQAACLDHTVYAHCIDRDGLRVSDYVELAKHHPCSKFILGHAGIGQADFTAIELIEHVDNMWFETSGGMFGVVAHAVSVLGSERVIFGSEYPLQHPRIELTKIDCLELSDEDYRNVMGATIARLIGERAC